ncbi:hypothetical protein P280DRAFT_230435 [Massarina eburnea CBS 473.64]|uniref:Uncharacterized protein n=1 Tax=Massarina eburnea CBS 473.64 TaxID=1395130 RepID=A0A6A6SAR2_9PLEO|nr:hypothetical protein P280DRAFT_230435 [Massarina eburnea CBS 473.64]
MFYTVSLLGIASPLSAYSSARSLRPIIESAYAGMWENGHTETVEVVGGIEGFWKPRREKDEDQKSRAVDCATCSMQGGRALRC